MTVTATPTCPPMVSMVDHLPHLPDYRWIHVAWTISLPEIANMNQAHRQVASGSGRPAARTLPGSDAEN